MSIRAISMKERFSVCGVLCLPNDLSAVRANYLHINATPNMALKRDARTCRLTSWLRHRSRPLALRYAMRKQPYLRSCGRASPAPSSWLLRLSRHAVRYSSVLAYARTDRSALRCCNQFHLLLSSPTCRQGLSLVSSHILSYNCAFEQMPKASLGFVTRPARHCSRRR